MGNARTKPDYLAGKLSLIRSKLKLNQSEMAEEVSVKNIILRKSDVSRYESGLREPPLIILLKYAKLAEISIDDLADDSVSLEDFSVLINLREKF